MSDYNQQINIAKTIMKQDKEALLNLSKHDLTKIDQLRKEHPNLDNYILSLLDVITELERKNKELVKRHIELEDSLIELRKYYKEFERFASTVYSPNKSTYKELEDKLALAENSKQTAIDDLYETEIKPLLEKIKQYEKSLALTQSMTVNDSIRIKELQEIIKNQQTIIHYAAGYISACEQFRDKHPNYVKDWLFSGISGIAGYKNDNLNN